MAGTGAGSPDVLMNSGQASANAPAELLELLTEPRSCPDPRRIQMHDGEIVADERR